MSEIQNAKITKTMLGFEDHGILTCSLTFEYAGSGQSFGGHCMLNSDKGMKYIKGILEAVGVNEWEDLIGKNVRVEHSHQKVFRIGHIVNDKWFDPKALGYS